MLALPQQRVNLATALDPSFEEHSQERSAPRRSTLVQVRVLEGPDLGDGALVSDLSSGGAFLRTETRVEEGARLRLQLELPTDTRPLEVVARVVRSTANGVGVRFEEISARDRARLRSHAGYAEMDDAIVRLQRQLGDLIPGNLLPLGELSEIENILRLADLRMIDTTVLIPGRGFEPRTCRIARVELDPLDNDDPESAKLALEGVEIKSGFGSKVVYVTFAEGPLHYAFEAVVLRYGRDPVLALPRRIYVTERRTTNRTEAREVWCEFRASHAPGGTLRLPVLDLADGGASIKVASDTLLLPGTHLPSFRIYGGGNLKDVTGASVRHVHRLDEIHWRAGLQFDDHGFERQPFEELKTHPLRASRFAGLKRVLSLLEGTVRGWWRTPTRTSDGVEVVRYRNRIGNTVAAIVDANFDTDDESIQPDVVVVIAPAVLKRKEIFGLMSRTIIDDLSRDERKVVTLRFDACHLVGESTMDARLTAEDRPYYNWDLSQLEADIEASLQYVERRFRPAKRVLASLSLSAIPARRVVASESGPPVDLWISPFGCPDAQDMLRNYLAGLELFDEYLAGRGPEVIHIHGRPIRGRHFCMNAVETGLAFLDQARKDLSQITAPVTWILGTYDHWVTRSRVKAMLEAPGGGPREVFECATGHVLKEGAEAIEIFKLVSESISKHIFGSDRPARDPDMAHVMRQSRAEWSRVKRLKIPDSTDFWRRHLFGDDGDPVGYDVMLDHPEYPRFLKRQVELLDPRPGDRIADFGCGTGNLLMAMLSSYPRGEAPSEVAVLDLVPEALERTREKYQERYDRLGQEPPPITTLVADLEVSRLIAIRDFLSGEVWGIEALVDRVEGLRARTANKIADAYGKELHDILRGREASTARVMQLAPELDETEAEIVLELGRVARYLAGRTVLSDLRSGVELANTTADLRLVHLNFGASTQQSRLDLPDESFDRIGSSLVLSYLRDPIVAMREIYRLLEPGGVLVASSIRPNFDPSKLYAEEGAILRAKSEDGDQESQRKLDALRGFGNMISRLIELEEDGRFRFFSGSELRALALEAGFSNIHVFDSLGSPTTAVIIRAEKAP